MVTSMKIRTPKGVQGFTLIDSLIAVVVLATGILALTLLQVTMLRSAADARERSVAMSLAQNILEERRATGAQTQAAYQALSSQGVFSGTDCNYPDAAALVVPGTSGLPTDYRYCVSVQRFRASGNTFVAVPTSGATAPAYSGLIPEFKQITVQVGWRKNDNSWGNLRLGDALSGIPLINSNDLNNRPIAGGATQLPAQVKYDLTQLTQNTNFIPIAVGDGSGNQVAATNPTPKVIGGGIAETSFQIFTYSAASSYANVQRQIDTKVIGCSCTSRAAPSLLTPDQSTVTETFVTRPLRASYWDGSRYTAPAAATYPTTDLIGQERADRVGYQSPMCDVCCRDHVDPPSVDYDGANTGEQDDVPKYDPYRDTHTHYVVNASGATTSTPVTAPGQNYREVCRVVRVDGVYRVTQDPELDHYAFLPTDNSALDYRVTSSTAGYQNFVQSYMDNRILPLSGYSWDNNRVDVAALEDTNGLNAQATNPIDIYQSDRRYLQNRAILLDVLSYGAKSAIQDCIDQTGTGAPTDLACALRHTSFASINLTELTNWSVERATGVPSDPITVVPKNFSVTTPTGTPVAGQVRDSSGAIQNSLADAVGAINRSIATLADQAVHFFQSATDTFWPVSDRQSFRYVGGSRPSVRITVNVTNLAYFDNRTGNSAAPYVGWVNPSAGTQGDCVRTANTTSFVCDLFTTTNAGNVNLRLFNYYEQLSAENNGASCGSGSTRVRADLPRCGLYRPASITPIVPFVAPAWRTSSTSGRPGDDEFSIPLGLVTDGATYTVAFETGATLSATFTCDSLTGQPVLSFQDTECRR
jgi:type II secretory pathway pseudopilin PulG